MPSSTTATAQETFSLEHIMLHAAREDLVFYLPKMCNETRVTESNFRVNESVNAGQKIATIFEGKKQPEILFDKNFRPL